MLGFTSFVTLSKSSSKMAYSEAELSVHNSLKLPRGKQQLLSGNWATEINLHWREEQAATLLKCLDIEQQQPLRKQNE